MTQKLVIITIAYNSSATIEKTFKSVVEAKKHLPIHYLLIDGASTDSTLELAEKYSHTIDVLISEPDQGISDAMNKGIANAPEGPILFLHADDHIHQPQALAQVAQSAHQSPGIHACPIVFDYPDGSLETRQPHGYGFRQFFKTGFLHQATLVSKSVFAQIGTFDTAFTIAMDYDFFLRAQLARIAHYSHPDAFSTMSKTGISSQQDWPTLATRFAEEKKLHYKNCPNLLLKLVYHLYWCSYFSYRKVRHQVGREIR